MAKTPFVDLKSEDILSAHVSGIQHAVNKVEEALNMKTETKTNHALVAVNDQEDATLHNFIYEGTVRNWVESPAPVVKRNGTVVSASEYTLKAPYGAVIFNAQQSETDVITADFTHVTNKSNFVAATKQLPMLGPVGLYLSHGISGGAYATGVATLSNTIDAFPFLVLDTNTFDKMMFEISAAAGTKGVMAVYGDNGSCYPGALIAQTTEIATTSTGVKEANFANGDVTLQPGLYWLARWHDGAVSFNKGLTGPSAIAIGDVLDTSILSTVGTGPAGAIRSGAITYNGTFPATFPVLGTSGSKYMYRSSYASVWIRRKA